MFGIFKRKCKIHEYETITNLYGDAINQFPMKNGRVTRSIRRCKHCKKIIYSPMLDIKCDIVNFNSKF